MYQNLTFPHELENVEELRKKGLPRWCYLPPQKNRRQERHGVQSLGREDPLEEGMANRFSISMGRIPMERGDWWAYSP